MKTGTYTNKYGELLEMKTDGDEIMCRHDDIGTEWHELYTFIKRFILSKDEMDAITKFIENN